LNLQETIVHIDEQKLSITELTNRLENAIDEFRTYSKETPILELDTDYLDELCVRRMAYKSCLAAKVELVKC